jgi:hypothetical protein
LLLHHQVWWRNMRVDLGKRCEMCSVRVLVQRIFVNIHHHQSSRLGDVMVLT